MISYRKFISFIAPWFLLAFLMNMTRLFMTDVHSYVYMNWNLTLALLPLVFIFFFERTKNIYVKAFLFFAWLFFLPNSVYLITDFIHLRDVGPDWMLWFDGMMLFSYAVIGVFVSSYTMLRIGNNLFSSNKKREIFYFIISILVSFGVYLGRYIRWNTWDIITRPVDLTGNILDILSTGHMNNIFISTVVFFTFFVITSLHSFVYIFKEKEKRD
jgi:uncharacterized membrane protein